MVGVKTSFPFSPVQLQAVAADSRATRWRKPTSGHCECAAPRRAPTMPLGSRTRAKPRRGGLRHRPEVLDDDGAISLAHAWPPSSETAGNWLGSDWAHAFTVAGLAWSRRSACAMPVSWWWANAMGQGIADDANRFQPPIAKFVAPDDDAVVGRLAAFRADLSRR